jgi:hypothetical protein
MLKGGDERICTNAKEAPRSYMHLPCVRGEGAAGTKMQGEVLELCLKGVNQSWVDAECSFQFSMSAVFWLQN